MDEAISQGTEQLLYWRFVQGYYKDSMYGGGSRVFIVYVERHVDALLRFILRKSSIHNAKILAALDTIWRSHFHSSANQIAHHTTLDERGKLQEANINNAATIPQGNLVGLLQHSRKKCDF